MRLGKAVVVSGVMALSGCEAAPRASMPDVRLSTVSARQGESLASCPTAKCLTVYVAPWCGYCRSGTPMLIELKKHLENRNVAMRVVVGMDDPGPVRAYALEFGTDSLIDPSGSLKTNGVPHFWVTNAAGKVLREVGGLPQAETVGDLAEYFGL